MAQWLICPYWVSEHRTLEDDSGRTYQADYQITEVHVTNPGDAEGRLDLVFYEARGDGNFYRSDWASGSWSAPPKYQRYYRPDPSLVYGDSFFTYGWFEMWMEPELNGDRCGSLEDHPESGGRVSGKRIAADGAAGDEARAATLQTSRALRSPAVAVYLSGRDGVRRWRRDGRHAVAAVIPQ